MIQFQSSTQATIYQMTALTASFVTMLASIALLTTQKLITTTNPLPIRARKRLAIRRTMGVCMLALGLLGVARSFCGYKSLGVVGYTTISSAVLILYAYIGFTVLGSKLARTEIAVGNAAMTLLFPAMWLCTDFDPTTQEAVGNVFFCYLALQIGVYAAVFYAECRKCKKAERRRYAAIIILPTLVFGIWSAIGWVCPSAMSAIVLMIISTFYMLSITKLFIKHTYSKRRIS